MPDAQLRAVDVEGAPDGATEIMALSFDARVLRITVEFSDSKEREWAYLDFSFPRGFRVLDEGDLNEFWSGAPSMKSFLHIVESGGWFDLEAQRKGFVTSRGAVTEYLVLGIDGCASILAIEPPKITICK